MSKAKLYLQYENQHLVLGPQKKSLRSVVENYPGPTYVYDLDIVRERFEMMKSQLSGVQIYYAMKANPHLQILKELKKMGSGVDVVSGGEIERALEAGFVPQDMIFSGVGKTIKELTQAIKLEIHQINVESIAELRRICTLSRQLGKKASIVFRLNPNVDIETHPYIATGLHNNKFGMAFSDLPELEEIILKNQDILSFKGVSLHLGSQMHNLAGFREAVQILREVFVNLQKRFASIDTFDVGGGLGIFYDKQDLSQEENLLTAYAGIVREELSSLKVRIQSEPGRWLVAHAGVLVTQVQYIKKTSVKNFIIVDTGMHHLLRPTLYGAHHAIWPYFQKTGPAIVYDVVGPICESGDFVALDRNLSEVCEDELLVIADVGAYGFAMRSDYNLQEPPGEIFI